MPEPRFTTDKMRCCNGPGDDASGCHIKAGKHWIATTHWGSDDTTTREMAVANGTLFSVANEMYAMLDILTATLPAEQAEAVEALLAKARGEVLAQGRLEL